MKRLKRVPVALTIAGSDSGGGAGLQADLKTFARLGVHGATAVTCLTAQNPAKISAIEAVSPGLVRSQLAAVFEELPPAAAKTGMLYTPAITKAVAAWFKQIPGLPLVVDPVMLATSQARLLQPAALQALTRDLLPLATLMTPNLDEAAVLLGAPVRSVEGMRTAARQLQARFGCAVLVKGGHLRGSREAIDLYFDGKTELLLQAPFLRGIRTHGTGCTYSAAITACLARGFSLSRSVQAAKEEITRALAASYRIGAHTAMG